MLLLMFVLHARLSAGVEIVPWLGHDPHFLSNLRVHKVVSWSSFRFRPRWSELGLLQPRSVESKTGFDPSLDFYLVFSNKFLGGVQHTPSTIFSVGSKATSFPRLKDDTLHWIKSYLFFWSKDSSSCTFILLLISFNSFPL